MTQFSFLDKVSHEIVSQFGDRLSEITIILPNKRARVFLLESLKKQLDQTVFAPDIISIEDFIQDVAGIRSVDSIELLFEFYEVYRSVTPSEKQQEFELFANWGKTLLQDFNEIDRYLLKPNHVFSYLKDIEVLKRWDLQPSQTTVLIDNHLEFWSHLPKYYETLYLHLKNRGIGYQGLIYREAVENLHYFSESLGNKQLVFAGFNALNQAEEKIIQQLLFNEQANIFWDIDAAFLNDGLHDAGLFIRRFKKEWKQFVNQPFEWITTEFSQQKNIQIIGTPKTIGQAKIAGKIIEGIQANGESLDKTALVLGEENLLLPALYALPNTVESLNITMGYGSKNNPAQILISKLFKLHANALQRSETSYTFYYKEVLDILTHPLVEPYSNASSVIRIINQNNITFLSQKKFLELNQNTSELFQLLFERWDNDIVTVLNRLSSIILSIKSFLGNDTEEEKVTKAFLYSIFKTINKLINYQEKYGQIDSVAMLHSVYKQIIDLAEVSFEGEPLSGLQIMGVLESRVLDFDNVIITSMNEGVFPAGKSTNSFIPYDVKRELGLPTYKEKDAIYCYHFYHLLLRAKNIYLLYNTESEGLDAGEKSRFITQLEIEKQPNHIITHQIYNAYLPEKAYEPIVVPKSKRVMERLKEIATGRGFSPSGLTSYIRNPIQFYNQRVLRISEVEEVEENIALNTLGTIIHGALEELYTPFLNRFLSVEIISEMLSKANAEVEKQFREVYKEGEIKKGKNLLAFEVAKRNVFNFLNEEKRLIENGDAVKVLALETSLERILDDNRLPYPVKIAGNVDRIEQRNGKIRIIDYKTGKVELKSVQLKDWAGLTADIKNDKIIQLLCYAFMFEKQKSGMEMEAGIISFKNMKAGFLPFAVKEDKNADVVIDEAVLEDFKIEVVNLINEILDAEIPFEEELE
ncbi:MULTISPECIES: PD-(D/E)XK nuclease family protein [Flavobacterium]|uniref:PD-(D/E)XK nuclease family protein n=1 Tax=Flavobacterium TaxID=237 RepID=UPI001FCB3A44|nr:MULTISPECIES: PD-(D/E)XK nuclease family protein [Flavobacterium]UOK43301.1 PD-(D/E)XK nuclease family protein [Flavobacterium enshiense]